MSGDQETLASQRARRAAGWVWLKIQVPPDLKRRLQAIASSYGLSLSQAHLDGLMFITYYAPRDWWRQRRQVPKVRFRRRDVGLCRVCGARLKVGAEAQRQYQARKRAERGDVNAPKPPATDPPEREM